jgi:hypothetical protein
MNALLDWAYDDFINDFSPENRGTTIAVAVVSTLLIWTVYIVWNWKDVVRGYRGEV